MASVLRARRDRITIVIVRSGADGARGEAEPSGFFLLIRVQHWPKKLFRLLVVIPLIIFANAVEARLLTA